MSQPQLPQALADFRDEIIRATVGSGYFFPAYLIIESKFFNARLTALLCEFELKGEFICTYKEDVYLFTRSGQKEWDIVYCDRPHCLLFTKGISRKAMKSKLQSLRDDYPEIEWIYVNHLKTPFQSVFQEKLDGLLRSA